MLAVTVQGTAASLTQSDSDRDSASGYTVFRYGSGRIRADSVSRFHLDRPARAADPISEPFLTLRLGLGHPGPLASTEPASDPGPAPGQHVHGH